ncbi:hypothetical protein [Nitrospira sp. Kam-Ns4a]
MTSRRWWSGLLLGALCGPALGFAEEPPLTRNVPIEKFQDPGPLEPYDFNAPPKGIFHSIVTARNFEEELGFRRSHEIVPVEPTEVFSPDARVFIVFKLFQHYESFQVFGVCYPEKVDGLDPTKPIAQDTMYIALEDESGYLKFFAPDQGWKPGQYKVEIYVGWQVNPIGLVGTMRFTVKAPAGEPPRAANPIQ